MRIVLANPRGFCAGVRMAIDVVEQVVDVLGDREPVYVYHEIVHNRHVVERLKAKGVRFVDDLAEVPEGSVVVFSAHGVSPAIRRQAEARHLTAIDATCPLVTKVHSRAIRYARQGYQILLIGHRDHQEIIGTSGEAPEQTQVVESPADIPHLRIDDPDKLVYLTQTTLSTDDAGVIIAALKAAFPNIKEPPDEDICYATTNRQHAVRQIAPHCDLVIVVGSRNSSNSVRLVEIAENVGTRGVRIDDVTELDPAWYPKGDETILLTAGASAPEDLVSAICRHFVEQHGATLHLADVFEESVEFGLPLSLKKLMLANGIDPGDRKVKVEPPVVTAGEYGANAVALTISAKGA
ncbi:MAG: 4-hydroxy-3-methylbut-2-enyl diphosphate reductase [Planctomycetota bacterium]|nr:MAG: 4-hydroxy-3-methylbut-2-enyl diphosphate reductase [Planctomycetota bacterium]